MAQKEKTIIKLQLPAGKASPAPPVGPALGQHGVNIMDFCNAFNAKTRERGDLIIPVEIRVYPNRSFDFILKTPPASVLIRKALNLEKGSSNSLTQKVGKLKLEQLKEIAQTKLVDLNARKLDSAEKIIRGTARSMGVDVEEEN